MLTQKAEKLRKEVGSPATALGIDDAIKEIKEINSALNNLETEFSTETARQVEPVRQFYDSKMRKVYDQRNQPKSMYETDSDYKKRVAQFDKQISEIKSEMDLKISDIRQKIDNELRQQKRPLLNQRAEITKLVFPIGTGNLTFKFATYDAEIQEFDLRFIITEKRNIITVFASLPIPKRKAAQYGKHPELLVPEVNIRLNINADLIPDKFSRSGPEQDKYICNVNSINNLKSFTNQWGMTFVYIPAGRFEMGSPENEPHRDNDEIQHTVILTEYYMQTTEITQAQWKSVMGNNPSHNKEYGDSCPVEQVSWYDVQRFIAKLNAIDRVRKYRLPTEAEWEYAARAGTTTPFALGSKCLGLNFAYCSYSEPFLPGCSKEKRDRRGTLPVGSLLWNAWGLYDMHGNLWEWCLDWYGDYPTGDVIDPTGPATGSRRVARGGCLCTYIRGCRSAARESFEPTPGFTVGFRLCCKDR